ncbi:MAG: acetylglutamate kinase [Bryobacteraceae bacterium]
MKILIKIGGTLLDSQEKVRSIATQLASIGSNHQVVVVHGGGKEVTRFLSERGVETRFQHGLRVSDATVIDAVTKVIAGTVNKRLVAALIAAGRPAIGLSGVDGLLTHAVQLDPELEFVGRPTSTDGKLLDLLAGSEYLPVVACVAADEKGNIYNVNADVMAVSAALGWHASRLFFLTDVPGVKDAAGSLAPELTSAEMAELIRSGVASGGMQAKLEAAQQAVGGGMEVVIASGSEPQVILRLLAGEKVGTHLVGVKQSSPQAAEAHRR